MQLLVLHRQPVLTFLLQMSELVVEGVGQAMVHREMAMNTMNYCMLTCWMWMEIG